MGKRLFAGAVIILALLIIIGYWIFSIFPYQHKLSTIVTPSVAEEIGIAQEIPEATQSGSGCSGGECQGVGGKIRGYGTYVDQLTVGGATQSNIMVAIIDLKIISPLGKKIDYGIIGYPFLKDYRLMIDYPNQQFALLDSHEH